SHQRGLGDAQIGRPEGAVLGGASARSDCPESRSSDLRSPAVTPLEFDYLRRLLKDRSGLVLSADKQYLVESRLTPLARKAGLASLGEVVAKLKTSNNERLIVDVVEAMTTNESFFYRDKIPFDHFREAIMPGLIAARARERRIRIW